MSTAAEPPELEPTAPLPETAAPTTAFKEDDVEAVAYFKEAHAAIKHQLGKVIVGQEDRKSVV